MQRRPAALALLLVWLLLFPWLAQATEVDERDFDAIAPTRNPNASEYSTKHPEELQPEHIVAHSFILMERSSGKVLLERNADELMFPASTTKILTALMALEYGNPDDTLEVSETALDLPDDSSRVPFKQGEVITLRDALYGLMLRSGNEAANAIAEHIAGDIPTFVEQMNATARMLGCENTHFVNPHGLHDVTHVTTARDLAKIMDAALDNKMFRQIIASTEFDLSATEMNPARKIENINLHIQKGNNYYYKNSIGGKTGFHFEAGYTLVEAAQRDGVELIAVIMYSNKYARWPDTSRLFEYGFSQYMSVTPEEIYNEHPTTLQIQGFDTNDPHLGSLELEISPVDSSRVVRFTDQVAIIEAIIENYNKYTDTRWTVDLRAPIEKGQVVGVITFYPPPPDDEPAQYNLIASRSIAARVDAPPTLEEIEQRVKEDPSPFPPFGWDWVLPPVLGVAAAVLALRAVIRAGLKRRKGKKQIPVPKRRYFS